MTSARKLAWLDRLIWTLIYAGLFGLVLGLASWNRHAAAGWTLMLIGSLMALAGVILIWVRSRLSVSD